jgi:uncharacterized damage-inducible protein DinB
MKAVVCLLVAGLVALGLAQQPSASQQPPASASSTDLATSIQRQYKNVRGFVAAAAEKMSETDYGFRPQGVAPEVRTFGQLIAHIANVNGGACARAKGEQPKPPTNEKTVTDKASLVKALNDALTACDAVYASLTDASLVEKIKVQGRGGAQNEVARGAGLITNISHTNEHYGNIVTYMRAKGLVPPSSEGR